jgi:hypothetical protein
MADLAEPRSRGQDFSKCRMLLRRPRGLCGRALLKGIPETADWNHAVSRIDESPGAISVKIISPPVHLSRDSLLELLDVMMIAAHDSGCVFDGFHVDLSDLRQRPRWKFW